MPTRSSKPFLSVVIPAYNEAGNYQNGVLEPAIKYLAAQKCSWELIFVDDGSTDNTKNLLQKFCRIHPNSSVTTIEHGGKSAAVTAGILLAKGEIILMTDFDQSTPLFQVEKFIEAHANGADVVIGVRTATQKDSWVRQIRSWAFVTLVQLVALPGIQDTQCGFKSFTKQSARKIFANFRVSTQQTKVRGGYMGAFDVEILFLARKFGYKIWQVPVQWIKYTSNRLNIWREPLMMVRDTVKVRWFDLQGQYDR